MTQSIYSAMNQAVKQRYNQRVRYDSERRRRLGVEQLLRDEVNAEVAAADDTPERDPQAMSQHRDRIGQLFDAIGMAEVRR